MPASPRGPARAHWPEVAVSLAIVVLGAVVISGWLLQAPAMVAFKAGMVPMVFDSALAFCLAGIALGLGHLSDGTSRGIRTLLGVVLVLLCSATLVEWSLDVDLGIDLAQVHVWYEYGNTRPGRMAPNSALAFILVGLAILLTDRVVSKARAAAAILLTFAVLGVGLTGLAGYYLAPDLLFEWARSARMAAHTAVGVILCSIALWLRCSRSGWYTSQTYFREDEKIRFLGCTILVILTMTAGLSGFVLQQGALRTILERGLDSDLQGRVTLFTNTVDQGVQSSVRAARRLEDESRAALDSPRSAAARKAWNDSAVEVATGRRWVALLDASDALQEALGKPSLSPRITAPLPSPDSAELLWDGELILRVRFSLLREGRRIGTILIDQSETLLNKGLFGAEMLGATGEIGACVLRHDELHCFPGNRHPEPFFAEPRRKRGLPFPIELAIAGESGHMHTLDLRGHNVIAAYGPLAPGLGLVVKQDTVEVYAVIRRALWFGIPIMAVITLLGAVLLYSQLSPLAARMLASEATANEREQEIRAIVESVAEGILTTDADGLIREVNPAVCEIFGYAPSELVGRGTNVLLLPGGQAVGEGGSGLGVRGWPPRLIGHSNVEVAGLRKDGAAFPLELTVKEMQLSGSRMLVGVMRDITLRKEAEARLAAEAQHDSLTGLPNRLLFLDRLARATFRVGRSKRPFALMFLDLDGFKQVNDTFGHQGGDEMLIQFAGRLSDAVRVTDTVARLAGDEFTIILESLTAPRDDARSMAEKIILSMQEPFRIGGQDIRVTASLGMVIYESGELSADLLARADKEMYAAKRAGKNGISFG